MSLFERTIPGFAEIIGVKEEPTRQLELWLVGLFFLLLFSMYDLYA